MRAAIAVGPMPRVLASSANCLFHASKPADVLPHCAARACPVIDASASKTTTVTIFSCLPWDIVISFERLGVAVVIGYAAKR